MTIINSHQKTPDTIYSTSSISKSVKSSSMDFKCNVKKIENETLSNNEKKTIKFRVISFLERK